MQCPKVPINVAYSNICTTFPSGINPPCAKTLDQHLNTEQLASAKQCMVSCQRWKDILNTNYQITNGLGVSIDAFTADASLESPECYSFYTKVYPGFSTDVTQQTNNNFNTNNQSMPQPSVAQCGT